MDRHSYTKCGHRMCWLGYSMNNTHTVQANIQCHTLVHNSIQIDRQSVTIRSPPLYCMYNTIQGMIRISKHIFMCEHQVVSIIGSMIERGMGQCTCTHTGDGLSLSLSVFLRRLLFLPVREEEEAEGWMCGLVGFSAGFLVSAASASAAASNYTTTHTATHSKCSKCWLFPSFLYHVRCMYHAHIMSVHCSSNMYIHTYILHKLFWHFFIT